MLISETAAATGREVPEARTAADVVLALHADFLVLVPVLFEYGAAVETALAGAEIATPASVLDAITDEATAVAETTPWEAVSAPEYNAGPGTTYEARAA